MNTDVSVTAYATSEAHTSVSGKFTEAGVARMAKAVQTAVDGGDVAGIVTLIARGSEMHVHTSGMQDRESSTPMQRDTIFRIASMTKPICAVAALMLVEEGTFTLDTPVDEWLPELGKRQVLRAIDSQLDDTVAAARAVTVRDLLTLRMGIGAIMEAPGTYPIQSAMAAAGLQPSGEVFGEGQDVFMQRLQALPLIHQPGTRWMYHTGIDVLGVLIARAAGVTLSTFLHERIFVPLRMTDTAFFVPDSKLGRLATCYQRDPHSNQLMMFDSARGGRFSHPPAFESGGGGLVSTADDFLKFARMLLPERSDGESTVRLLSAASVAEMTTDQISAEQKAASPFIPGFWDTNGWGFGISMNTAPDDASPEPGRLGWGGGFGTQFIADPSQNLIAILLLQRVISGPDDESVNEAFIRNVYDALS